MFKVSNKSPLIICCLALMLVPFAVDANTFKTDIENIISNRMAAGSSLPKPQVSFFGCDRIYEGSKIGLCNCIIAPPRDANVTISPALHQFLITSHNTITHGKVAIYRDQDPKLSIIDLACGVDNNATITTSDYLFGDLKNWKKAEVDCSNSKKTVYFGEGVVAEEILEIKKTLR